MSNKTKQPNPIASEAQLLISGDTVTVAGQTVKLIPYADLPRKVRRDLRNALYKAAPDQGSVSDKSDVYLAAFDAGIITLKACGVNIDPNDETLDAAEADALDQTIMIVGIRTLGSMPSSDGESKNAESNPSEDQPNA